MSNENQTSQNYLTDPTHGGKITCHKCQGFILEGDEKGYFLPVRMNKIAVAHFHNDCYNPYEHYYGLDKPID